MSKAAIFNEWRIAGPVNSEFVFDMDVLDKTEILIGHYMSQKQKQYQHQKRSTHKTNGNLS